MTKHDNPHRLSASSSLHVCTVSTDGSVYQTDQPCEPASLPRVRSLIDLISIDLTRKKKEYVVRLNTVRTAPSEWVDK